MKQFHIGDVLSVTTGRLVSPRHMEGIYDILNFLTGDNLFTHQLPRAMRECEPWLRTQFPQLFPDDAKMGPLFEKLSHDLDTVDRERIGYVIADWVKAVRVTFDLPETLPVYEMGADMHTHIDPLEELSAMVGDDKVIPVRID